MKRLEHNRFIRCSQPEKHSPPEAGVLELTGTCKAHGLATTLIVPLPIIFLVTNVEGNDENDPQVVWQEAYTESTQWRVTTGCDCELLPELIAEAFRKYLSECDGEVVMVLYNDPVPPLFRSPTAILRSVRHGEADDSPSYEAL